MPELRKKILYTLFILLIFRFGSCIPVPFIDTQMLDAYFQTAAISGSMLDYLNMFTGGGLSNATIFAMSITPYINASIILQLLTVAIPALERMVKDGGEEGRKKIASWTRYVAVALGRLFSSFLYSKTSLAPPFPSPFPAPLQKRTKTAAGICVGLPVKNGGKLLKTEPVLC